MSSFTPSGTSGRHHSCASAVTDVTLRSARWPKVVLQFEDFAASKAMRILNTYRDTDLCFNDDIQARNV